MKVLTASTNFVFCFYVFFYIFNIFYIFKNVFFIFMFFALTVITWAVKIYLHAKCLASSSKIEQVMVNFVLPPAPPPAPLVTNLPVELCASRQLINEH